MCIYINTEYWLEYFYKLDWGSYIDNTIAKTTAKEIRSMDRFMKFLSTEVVL